MPVAQSDDTDIQFKIAQIGVTLKAPIFLITTNINIFS